MKNVTYCHNTVVTVLQQCHKTVAIAKLLCLAMSTCCLQYLGMALKVHSHHQYTKLWQTFYHQSLMYVSRF